MMKSVQATLMHCNSTNDHPRHNLCSVSWCKWLQAKGKGEEKEFNYKKPIPPAIVELLKPIYARLGSSWKSV